MDHIGAWRIGLLLSLAHLGCGAKSPTQTIAFSATFGLESRTGSIVGQADSAANIWRMNADGTGLMALTHYSARYAGANGPKWSPDGSKIAFLSNGNLDGSDAAGINNPLNVWLMNADGSGRVPLTHVTGVGVYAEHVDWSLDGSKIVFSSSLMLDGSNGVNPTVNIWRINSHGTGLVPLTRLTAPLAQSSEPQWSPDGNEIVFASTRTLDGNDMGAGFWNIWKMNADGSSAVPLTTWRDAASSGSPRWSPDGTKIAYLAPDGIRKMKPDGSSSTLVTGGIDPEWSPDDRRLAFITRERLDGSFDQLAPSNIWVVHVDGSGREPLTKATAYYADNYPSRWSPDGSKLVFPSTRNLDGSDTTDPNFTVNIWAMKADGTGLTPLTKASIPHTWSGGVQFQPH